MIGYGYTAAGCVPCQVGCQICNGAMLTACSACIPGYSLNSKYVCVKNTNCSAGCTECNSFGCTSCMYPLILTQSFQCQYFCFSPCATCSPTNPTMCITCLLGYSLTRGQCIANLNCNSLATCITCPFGYSLVTNSDQVRINQTCIACNPTSNCARCTSANNTICTSCSLGMYLKNTACLNCAAGCALCSSLSQCLFCTPGYVQVQSGSLVGITTLGLSLKTCQPCASPCSTCIGSTTTCMSCVNNFGLFGTVCISNFNYQISTVLGVKLSVFQSNYLNFTNQIASAAGVNVDDIAVLSITSGSVTVNMAITSFNSPG